MDYKVKVKGSSPYMQHRMDDRKLEDWEKERGPLFERDSLADDKSKRAAYHSYIDENNNYYIPSDHFKQCFIGGGGFVKGKVGGKTKTMKNIVAAMWRVMPERIPLGRPFDMVDSRSAVNKNVKARVMVHRPRWNEWEAEIIVSIDEDPKNRLTKETVEQIINYSGRYMGIGSYRPEHTGDFGRFTIVSLEAIG